MGKKKKTKAFKRASMRRRKRWLPLAAAALLVQATAGYAMTNTTTPAQHRPKAGNCSLEGYKRAEARPPLSPALFSGRAHMAYAYAMSIPAVIDQLYCYCHCKGNMGHKSLLSCYADTHAANCDVCLAEAEIAAKMAVKGSCPAEIQKAIDRRFERR